MANGSVVSRRSLVIIMLWFRSESRRANVSIYTLVGNLAGSPNPLEPSVIMWLQFECSAPYRPTTYRFCSAPVGERSFAISLSVCLSLSVREHISGTAGPTFTESLVQIPCGRGSLLLWRRCDTLCTSGFMDDVTFGRNSPYDVAILGRSLMSMNALFNFWHSGTLALSPKRQSARMSDIKNGSFGLYGL